jgi:hypothetical protein
MMTPVVMKTLTTENWLQPDIIPSALTKLSLNDQYAYLMTAEDWVAQFIDPKLNPTVPNDVQVLFEVARGALAYGYFFYPLYTLAAEQLFRVGEAAISAKYLLAGGTKSQKSFHEKLEYLRDNKMITDIESSRWQNIRRFRNLVSHPESQNIFPPGQIVGMLKHMTDVINNLFA